MVENLCVWLFCEKPNTPVAEILKSGSQTRLSDGGPLGLGTMTAVLAFEVVAWWWMGRLWAYAEY